MKAPRPVELLIPKLPSQNWVVVGLDLSLTRTGYAVLDVEHGVARWASVGSWAPKDSKEETWARASAIAHAVKSLLNRIAEERLLHLSAKSWGCILSVEFPDPKNSYLMGLNQVVQTILWSEPCPALQLFSNSTGAFRLAVNAATLRSVLRLGSKRTGTDKDENKEMAYEYLGDPKDWPSLDSDSCDAVLLAIFGGHAAQILSGYEGKVPPKSLHKLCTADVLEKKRGKTVVQKPQGLLHDPAAWWRVQTPTCVELRYTNAASKERSSVGIIRL